MTNTLGQLFRITTFGESHGGGVGVIIDGCPSGFKIDMKKVQNWLNRRRPGQSHLTSPRDELDEVVILSGLEDNITLGTPLALMIQNKGAKKSHYADMVKTYRPSHADYTTEVKYGLRASSGGGRASARETIGRVAAAAIAEQVLHHHLPKFAVIAWVSSVKDIQAPLPKLDKITRDQVDKSPLRCPDQRSSQDMEALVLDAKDSGDSVGGCIDCIIRGVPAGLGEPVFDKLEAELAKALMSLPASKGFEVGSGFSGTKMLGSEHNDQFTTDKQGNITTTTNHSGGIQGGISNGETIILRVAFKPVSTIFKPQQTVTSQGKKVEFTPERGRHDPCVLPRAVPMVEAMAILVIMDHWLRQQALIAARK